jgi:2-methylcitrate dehydratase PrpD
MCTSAINYTRFIADFVASTCYDDIPPNVIVSVKMHILDAIGIALGAFSTQHPLIQALTRLIADTSGREEAMVWGAGIKVPAPEAAFVNAVLTNFLDFSDGHYMGGHINDRLVPVALAAAEVANASGKDLLTALAIGYEVYIDLAYTLFSQTDPAEVRLPYFVLLGPVVAAVVAGKLLDLSPEQLAGAMGLAASYQLGAAQYVLSGGHEKDLSPGHEARRGLYAALLAAYGILGSLDILEGQHGICTFLRVPPFSSQLGRVWRISECYFKPYPACRYLHASIEAACHIVKEHSFDAQEIKSVTVITNSASATRVSYEIKSHVNAIFSHAYQVANVLRYRRIDLPTMWREKIKDPLFVDIMKKVKVLATEEYDQLYAKKSIVTPPWPAEVEVILENNKKLHARVLAPKGDPTNPMTREELYAKFESLTNKYLSTAQISQLLDQLENLENLEKIRSLTALLKLAKTS